MFCYFRQSNPRRIAISPIASFPIMRFFACALLLQCLAATGLFGQGSGVPIEPNYLVPKTTGLIEKTREYKAHGGVILNQNEVAKALKSPSPMALSLPARSNEKLEVAALAERTRKALMRVGWVYLCPNCHKWHADLSGGYSITADGAVVTCYHCVEPDADDMTEGYLVATDADGHFYPVTAILAADQEMDTAILKVEAHDRTALPINDQGAPGDATFVFSDPLSIAGYFTTGVVNRYFWKEASETNNANTLEGARNLRLHVSNDWGMGSSGSAVVDQCGNVIGHVSEIQALGYDSGGNDEPVQTEAADPDKPVTVNPEDLENARTILILHEAVAARGVRLLVEKMGRN